MPKFNYTKRKSEGPKLGAIVRKDLGKRIKVTSAHRDNSAVEVNLEGKNLTDDGLCEVAAGLVEILTAPAFDEKLHVLNLANNNLSIKSLSHLAPAIEAAASELLDLDLSGNNISPSAKDELDIWENFLASFRDCRVLKRLSLAGNDIGPAPSWDVFFRAYLEQLCSTKLMWQDLDAPLQDDEDGESDFGNDFSALNIETDSAAKNSIPRSGLPSIQIFDLSATGLTDAGSLFLSYVLERNSFNKITTGHNKDLPSSASSGSASGFGILWQPNNKLGSLGIKILKDAEKVSWQPSCTNGQDSHGNSNFHGNPDHAQENKMNLMTAPHSHRRRSSQVSSDLQQQFRSPSHLKESAAEELDSLRKKIQRGIIEDDRLHTIELWISALRLLALVRQNLIPRRPFIPTPRPADWVRRPTVAPEPAPTGLQSWTRLPIVPIPDIKPVALPHIPKFSKGGANRSSLMPKLPAPPALPAIPMASRKSSQRNASNDLGMLATPLSLKDLVNDSEPMPHQTWTAKSQNTNPNMVGKLPRNALERVLCLLADPNGILSLAQQRKIIKWGSDRETLVMEQESLGKPRSVQIWRVLEALDCLTYDDPSH